MKEFFGSKKLSTAEYNNEYAWHERKLTPLLSSFQFFTTWLAQIHLQGFVFNGFDSLMVNSKHKLFFDEQLIDRPQVHFSKLTKAQKQKIDYRPFDEISTLFNVFSDPILIVTDNKSAPESVFGHFDARSNIYQIGILLTELFSECNVNAIEELRELITNKASKFKWQNHKLKSLALECLNPNPSGRISIHELDSKLADLVIQIGDDTGQNYSAYHTILKQFKASLLDFSARNHLFNFRESAQYLTVEADFRQLADVGFNWQFDLETNNSLLKKLHHIRRKHQTLLREKGEDGLLLITHFLNWQNDNDTLNSPFLLSNCDLIYSKGFNHKYKLELDPNEFRVNDVLRIYFKENFDFQFPKIVAAEDINVFLSNIETLLKDQGAKINSIDAMPVLGVFSYHNISIASDYNELLKTNANPINLNLLGFEKTLNTQVAATDTSFWDEHFVLPADPSQQTAITESKSNSIVIEGPPGTGKSQTIVNLLAQALANKEKVLFVSEKRAALDVVYNRLDKAGIADLALRVHNPKKEKKEINESISVAHKRLSQPLERDAELGKKLASWKLEEVYENLDAYYQIVRTKQHGFSLNELFLFDSDLDEQFDESWVPDLGDWLKQKPLITELKALLYKMGLNSVWKQNALASLDTRSFVLSNEPKQLLAKAIELSNKVILNIEPLLNKIDLQLYIGDLLHILSLSKSLKWLIDQNLVKLILDNNTLKKSYEKLKDQYLGKQALIDKRKGKIPDDTFHNISLRELESALLKYENEPNSAELTQFVASFSDTNEWFADDLKSILKNAIFTKKNELQLTEIESKFRTQFKTEDPNAFIEQVSLLQDLSNRNQYHLRDFYDLLNQKRFPDAFIKTFLDLEEAFQILEKYGFIVHKDFRKLELKELKQHLKAVEKFPFTVQVEKAVEIFNGLKPSLKYCIERSELPIDLLEKASVKRELKRAYIAYPDLETFDSKKLNTLLNAINVSYDEWLVCNSHKILDGQIVQFQQLSQIAETPAAKLQDEQKQEKWAFKKGIRIIKNEIDKTRQHKSLRELVNSDAESALNVLKPVYLMSPVAVAETFACQSELFDLVVFDEASQLRLEEVLPVVHRAKRVVVVGDSEQLPPTDFFRSSALQAKTADQLLFSSFLMAAKAAFKTQSLSWHYRSMSQELIQFSNAAFYGKNLKVFPSFGATRPPLRAFKVNGVYENRKNEIEAGKLVKHLSELLKSDATSTYAIITLSESQQECVENAMGELRKTDAAFNQLIDREESRFENDAFAGLIIKNLENMQGEERDVVLISLGYGHDAEGGFRQNFGPIMREGGDRRLNVLFSRAKSQMLIFHSFDIEEITNDQNLGLWTLKQFLKYAKAVENHDVKQQLNVLRLMQRGKASEKNDSEFKNEVINSFKRQLKRKQTLLPINVANASDQLHYQLTESEEETHKIYEFEAAEPNTWNEFFISKRVLENRGFEVEKVSTQELKSTLKK